MIPGIFTLSRPSVGIFKRCISDGGFAETTSYLLHGILYLFFGYALLHIIEQRNLLRIALRESSMARTVTARTFVFQVYRS